MSIEAGILRENPAIVVYGLSSNPSKPSYYVTEYMQSQGYRIIPVNPDEEEVFGLRCYPTLQSVPEPVQFVNVFRRAEFCGDVARDAIAAGARVIWLQSGIRSAEARGLAQAAGVTYVEDRCVMVEHRRNGIGRIDPAGAASQAS